MPYSHSKPIPIPERIDPVIRKATIGACLAPPTPPSYESSPISRMMFTQQSKK